MITHTLNPVLLDLGPVQIRYYGLFYVIGLFLTYVIIKHLVKKERVRLTKDEVLEYVIWLSFGILAGARIFYFVFYDTQAIWQNPAEILMLWHGGMSFHGGFIGASVAGILFSRKKHIPFYTIADMTVIPLALSLALGRIGNFINGELAGRVWEQGFLRDRFCVDYSKNQYIANPEEACRYPSQLVESAKNLLIFSILWLAKDFRVSSKRLPAGTLYWLFGLTYSVLRFFVEFIREPDPQLGFVYGWLTMGQLLSIIMFALSLGMLLLIFIKRDKEIKTKR
ncbi:prolipoprotein diacylglyceryl transferase [Candidatus Woesearchaeota archaeon]|nr:prolipoprotein diacylglyceryl transferase [Candidatus Woesearchaeota archaeon]